MERLRSRRIPKCLPAPRHLPIETYLSTISCRTDSTKTYLQNQHLRILLCQLEDDLIHLLARLRPWCPEVDERDALEVLGEEALEVLRRLHIVEVRWDSSCHFFVCSFDLIKKPRNSAVVIAVESSCAGSEQQSREQYVQEIGSDAGVRVQVQTDGDELGEEEEED